MGLQVRCEMEVRWDVRSAPNFIESSAETLHPAALVYSCTSLRIYLLKGSDHVVSTDCSLGLIFAITPHQMNTAVHLPIRDQLFFSHTTPDYIFIFITRHLIVFAINSTHLSVTIVPSRFSAVFFNADFCRLFSDVVIFT